MKQLVCEMCGSNDMVKDGGLFICQSCGCKYTVEEAKKLMVEGKVKIDNSDRIKNLYTLARRAKDANDSENAIKYYNEIMQEKPDDWEPAFYSAFFSLISSKIIQIPVAAETFSNCLATVCNLLHQISDNSEKRTAYNQVISYTLKASVAIIETAEASYNKYPDVENALGDCIKGCQDGLKPCMRLGDELQHCEEYDFALKTYSLIYNYVSKLRVNYLRGFDINPLQTSIDGIKKKTIDCYKKKNKAIFNSLNEERAQLERELIKVENSKSNSQSTDIEKLISEKQTQLSKLGLFKQKEKKEIKQEIDDLNRQLQTLNTDYFNKTIFPLKSKINAIDKQLNPSVESIIREIS